MQLEILPTTLAIVRLSPAEAIPSWSTQGSFFSISRSTDELSIVCESALVRDGVKVETDWRAFKVLGPLDFGLTGVLASIAIPLANAGISIFAISTFDTDYILVKGATLEAAIRALTSAGHAVSSHPRSRST